jgi:ABC-type antimicrobial peptide transport system permease subunit
VAGVGAGLAIGYVLLARINLAQTGWHLPFQPSVTLVLSAVIPVLAAATAAGWYPAKLAAKRPISNALGYE